MARYSARDKSIRIAGVLLLILTLSGCAGCGKLFEEPGLKITVTLGAVSRDRHKEP